MVKNVMPWIYVIEHLNRKEIGGTFYGRELQEINK